MCRSTGAGFNDLCLWCILSTAALSYPHSKCLFEVFSIEEFPADMASYLQKFNLVCGLLWAAVLCRILLAFVLAGPEYVAESSEEFVAYVQSLAILEVVHAAIGLVRSSPVTAAMQVASRLILVWGVVHLFPRAAETGFYTSMVAAWAVTEIVRYPYYYYQLRGRVPGWLEKLRYTTFIFLYPIGASSEAAIVWLAIPYAHQWSNSYAMFLRALLVLYPPAFYVLYTHMWKQRQKVLTR